METKATPDPRSQEWRCSHCGQWVSAIYDAHVHAESADVGSTLLPSERDQPISSLTLMKTFTVPRRLTDAVRTVRPNRP